MASSGIKSSRGKTPETAEDTGLEYNSTMARPVQTTCGAGNDGAQNVAVLTVMVVMAAVVVVSRILCVERSRNDHGTVTEGREGGREGATVGRNDRACFVVLFPMTYKKKLLAQTTAETIYNDRAGSFVGVILHRVTGRSFFPPSVTRRYLPKRAQ
ncbi:hypothetical protein E2C01_009363 [Portunus trituberculatus]|uniref:Uncharacterized protein n=1 Tax=Portunus trituberculatus TaxID=210409 RepID=A0A5B7D3B6_PORTR|nr:hypothetical protein [Portunus trituberculatus]